MRISAFSIVGAMMLGAALAACGGGGGGGTEEEAVTRAANNHVKVLFGVITGGGTGRDLLNVFAPECREDVNAADIDAALSLIRLFLPQLADVKIEDVDLGKLNLEKTSEGYEVAPADPDAMRIKVKGDWVGADEFFSRLGFDEADDIASDIETLLLVKRDGKWYIGDCDELEGLGGSGQSAGDTTPVAISTFPVPSGTRPTPARTGPGSSRTSPVRLGQAGRVDDTWEITVVAVDRDAWPEIQAEHSFNEPPAANERMLMITVRAKNVSSNQRPENVDAYTFSLVGSRNQLYDQFDEQTECGFIPEELDADLFPNGQAEGNVCFKVPSDETGFVLAWEELFGELVYFALE